MARSYPRWLEYGVPVLCKISAEGQLLDATQDPWLAVPPLLSVEQWRDVLLSHSVSSDPPSCLPSSSDSKNPGHYLESTR